MAKITSNDIINCEAPDDLFDSLIVQCMEKEFGPNKRTGNPQIVSKWEVLGVKNKDNKIDREITRNGVTYILAGLSIKPVYHTLTQKAIRFYRDGFWVKATGKPAKEFEIDTENPDIAFMDKLVMSAVVKVVVFDKTKPISEEQKAMLEEQGLPVKAELVLDDEGNPIQSKMLEIDTWNRRFNGELPVF